MHVKYAKLARLLKRQANLAHFWEALIITTANSQSPWSAPSVAQVNWSSVSQSTGHFNLVQDFLNVNIRKV